MTKWKQKRQYMQLEAIELHKLKLIIESEGGVVLDLSTDCIICNFPETNTLPFELEGDNLKGYYFDDENKVNKYKIEHTNDRLRLQKWNSSEEEKHIHIHHNHIIYIMM